MSSYTVYFLVPAQISEIPSQFKIGTTTNSPTAGQCSSMDILTCVQPASSVLFDGDIPSLLEVTRDSQAWASQLFAIPIPDGRDFSSLVFDFANVPTFSRIDRIEVVLLNCPNLGFGVRSIEVSQSPSSYLASNFDTFTASTSASSCSSLIRVCIPVGILHKVVTMTFYAPSTSFGREQWTYIAEIEFFSFDSSCNLRDGIVSPSLFSLNRSKVSSFELPSASRAQCSSCSASSYVLTAFLTAVITAIVTTVLFALVLFCGCKWSPRSAAGGSGVPSSSRDEPAASYKKFDEEKDEGLIANEPSNREDIETEA